MSSAQSSSSSPFSAPATELSPKEMRRIILQQSKRANVGHIGSCLSVVEIICALYRSVLRIEHPDDADRDRFILSKGHAALALYAALQLKGWVTAQQMDTFCGDDSMLGVHPESVLPGVDFSTGSLGQGPCIAAGAALAARLQGSNRRVFCLVSDGECNEGSVWEAAMFAAHHRLSNLTIIADMNGQQALGLTREVCDPGNAAQRWQAFGWDARTVDGHSVEALVAGLNEPATGQPRVLLAQTVFGRGVWFMEQGVPLTQQHLAVQPINWHYLPMSDREFEIAIGGLENA
jgi:transketolase